MLTGEISPALRSEEWESKRVFFMTPQTLENDLKTGIADPKKIVLLVVDEAHRATGNYAYVKVIEFIRRFNKSFRILALTATPGSSVEAVQEVIDGLEISQIEIRTEKSIDIQPYVHAREIEQIILEPDENLTMIQNLISKTLQPILNQLAGYVAGNGYVTRDPLALTSFGMLECGRQYASSGAGRSANHGLKNMVRALVSLLAGFGHSIKLLTIHGMRVFYQNMETYRSEGEVKRSKIGKYQKQILDSPHFKEMMDTLKQWTLDDNFVSHPKITYLCDTVLNHFMDAGDGLSGNSRSSTRIIVFCEYRASAEDIARTLNKHGPMIRASVFVGQADSKHSEGMKQKEQIETIEKFRDGTFNVIVATSIGEEGLDIGQVDLIICYDGSSSPIRMLQRMGRTGRKRAGRVVLLLMKGKEEASFAKANENYEKMQRMISDGKRFKFHAELSARIMPKDVTPVVDKRVVEIPVENTQDPSLPEPRRRPKKKTKMPKKKFNMPDDVETGFQPLSKLWGAQSAKVAKKTRPLNPELEPENLAIRPPLERVLLDEFDERILKERYQTIAGDEDFELEGGMPNMEKWPDYQHNLRPTVNIKHGVPSKRLVKMLRDMGSVDHTTVGAWEMLSDSRSRFRTPEYGDEDEQPRILEESDASTVDIDDLEERTSHAAPRNCAADGSSTRRSAAKAPKTRAKPVRKQQRNARGTSIDLRSSESGSDSHNDDQHDSELDDFVVPDDASTPSFVPRSVARISLSASISRKRSELAKERESSMEVSAKTEETPSRPQRFFEPTHFSATQEDDDLPDFAALAAKRKSSPTGKKTCGPKLQAQPKHVAKKVDVDDLWDDDDKSEDDEGEEVVAKKRKARPVIAESDDEEVVVKKPKKNSRPVLSDSDED